MIYPELWRPPPFSSHTSLEHSLVVKYKCRLHQAAYFFHVMPGLHDISSLNCPHYSNSDQPTHYSNEKPLPRWFFHQWRPHFSIPFLKLRHSPRFLFCKLDTCKTNYCFQFTSFPFQQHLLGLLFANDIMWRNKKHIALNTVWWRLNIF